MKKNKMILNLLKNNTDLDTFCEIFGLTKELL